MCRGFVENERETLKTKAFYTKLSPSCAKSTTALPDFLTLHYLPRINGSFLEVNGSNIRADSPAFVTLHRIVSVEPRGYTYGSRERVVLCEGAKFEIHVGEVRVLKGIFRKDDCSWKMDCKCVLAGDDVVRGVKEVVVSVVAEGAAEVMSEKVEMVAARRRRGCQLEEIPEEREGEGEGEWEFGSGVCWCSECREGEQEDVDGGDCELEMEMEGVHWALDLGVWVVCFGVGYLVSRGASSTSRRLRRNKFMRN